MDDNIVEKEISFMVANNMSGRSDEFLQGAIRMLETLKELTELSEDQCLELSTLDLAEDYMYSFIA